jgi:hypothetical protein
MHDVDADVWVLTETHRDLAPSPAHALAAHSGPAPDRKADRGEVWVAIWSRLPVIGSCQTADPARTAAARVLFAPDRPVIIHGTVLPWRADRARRPLGGAAAFAAALAEQAADWDRWRAEFPDHALCVAGDFNQELGGRCWVGSREGHRLIQNRLDGAGLVCVTGGTGDAVLALRGTPGIDHLCVGPGLGSAGRPPSTAWAGTTTDGVRLSDHYGVWADVRPDLTCVDSGSK